MGLAPFGIAGHLQHGPGRIGIAQLFYGTFNRQRIRTILLCQHGKSMGRRHTSVFARLGSRNRRNRCTVVF